MEPYWAYPPRGEGDCASTYLRVVVLAEPEAYSRGKADFLLEWWIDDDGNLRWDHTFPGDTPSSIPVFDSDRALEGYVAHVIDWLNFTYKKQKLLRAAGVT